MTAFVLSFQKYILGLIDPHLHDTLKTRKERRWYRTMCVYFSIPRHAIIPQKNEETNMKLFLLFT